MPFIHSFARKSWCTIISDFIDNSLGTGANNDPGIVLVCLAWLIIENCLKLDCCNYGFQENYGNNKIGELVRVN